MTCRKCAKYMECLRGGLTRPRIGSMDNIEYTCEHFEVPDPPADPPLTLLVPANAAAFTGHWFRIILPDATIHGRVAGVAGDGNTVRTSDCELAVVHLDTYNVWVESEADDSKERNAAVESAVT